MNVLFLHKSAAFLTRTAIWIATFSAIILGTIIFVKEVVVVVLHENIQSLARYSDSNSKQRILIGTLHTKYG